MKCHFSEDGILFWSLRHKYYTHRYNKNWRHNNNIEVQFCGMFCVFKKGRIVIGLGLNYYKGLHSYDISFLFFGFHYITKPHKENQSCEVELNKEMRSVLDKRHLSCIAFRKGLNSYAMTGEAFMYEKARCCFSGNRNKKTIKILKRSHWECKWIWLIVSKISGLWCKKMSTLNSLQPFYCWR